MSGCWASYPLFVYYRTDGVRLAAVDWAALLAGAWGGVGAGAMTPESQD